MRAGCVYGVAGGAGDARVTTMADNLVMKKPPVARSLVANLLLGCAVAGLVSGCAVVTVADAAVSVVATTVKVTAKTVGAAVDLAIPDDDEDENKDD